MKKKQIVNTTMSPVEPECVEPMWEMPKDVATIKLSHPEIAPKHRQVSGEVIIHDLRWFKEKDLSRLGPLILILQIKTSKVVHFPDRRTFLEHKIDPGQIVENGSYRFSFNLIGRGPGKISLSLFWKWRILTEGACAVAIDGVYAGCWIGGQLNKDCVCSVLANMPAPGSWACKIHPLTFRADWKLWGCPGPSPY